MRPFFPYYGSKWRSATKYPSPDGRVVVEPFAGSAGYSLRHNVQKAVLVDSYPVIVGVWDYIINASTADIAALPCVPKGADVRDIAFPCQEARWLVGFYCSPGSVAPANINSTKFTNCWGESAKTKIIEQKPMVKDWLVVEGSYERADAYCGDNHMMFIDPPYQKMGVFYKHSSIDYERLGAWCLQQKVPTIVCEAHGADWLAFDHTFDLQGAPQKGRPRSELKGGVGDDDAESKSVPSQPMRAFRFSLTPSAIIGEGARMAGKIKAGSKMLLVRLTPKEKAAIVAEARRNGMTIQAYVAAAMEAMRTNPLSP